MAAISQSNRDSNDSPGSGSAPDASPDDREVSHASGEHRLNLSARERTIQEIARSDIPVVTETTPLSELPDLFARTRAPIAVLVNADGEPIGGLTPVDLFGTVLKHGPVSLAGVGIRDAAHARVLYLRADTRLSSALRLFIEQRPECILVVDPAGRMVGIVTASELLEYLMR